MKERFEGADGHRLLIDSLLKQDIVEHSEPLASVLATTGELVTFAVGNDVVVQGAPDNDVYFLLAGEGNVLVHDRFVGSRAEGTCIGEMAAIDPAAPRSATIRAKSEIVALKVAEKNFTAAIDAHPRAYRALSQLLAYRLRERSKFHQPPNPQPVLFIGCSSEALSIANELQAGLKHDSITATIWSNGVFGPSGTAVESLYNFANSSDFAAFVVSPDDLVLSRDSETMAPRDNVVFELGLFMGRLEQKRVFLIREHSVDVKIPSDLLGITPITYVLKPGGNIASSLNPACTELRKAIAELGVR
jgi:predicted nucleotide-binding protein